MLRFKYFEVEGNNNAIANEKVLHMDNKIWDNSKRILFGYDKEQNHTMNMLPVRDAAGTLVAYGYQDNEADRELRMIRELAGNKHALQFTDIFPECRKVTIFGCNELAVAFAEYLKTLGVSVSVIGRYWHYFGYETSNADFLPEGETDFVIYAEGIPQPNRNLCQSVQKSVSPEFECIDKIYEANVLEKRICDTIGDFDEFIRILKNESEIVILGTGGEAQDAYDLLMAHGIDICCFAETGQASRRLLGKDVMSVADAIQRFRHPVFLNCRDTHGALGERWTEYFDYRGFERNKQYFLVRDYTDIPVSNLVHVLHGKNVLLTGDSRLCDLLTDYLNSIENGEIDVKYIALSEKVSVNENDILCLVVADYKNGNRKLVIERNQALSENLTKMGFVGYTTYFKCHRCFALIDRYLNRNSEKYTLPDLLPKGILIGRIPPGSGNAFFSGVLDGHPEILHIPYSDFNNNLFYYCVRLASIDSDKVLQTFWTMYDEEAGNRERVFPEQDKFEVKMRSLLRLKNRFTSQELFIVFHIAYAEMFSDKALSDLSDLIIYWEPHFVGRNEFPFLALWLEDKEINGHTLVLRRNNIVRTGSICKRKVDKWEVSTPFHTMFLDESIWWDGFRLAYSYWSEYKLRFEDIKVNPKNELMKVCKLMDISWSDSMLRTTKMGQPYEYRGSADYDLKAVFTEYAEYLSVFDRFRISIASSPYQKRYGYAYYDCTKFSRRELRDMFLMPFLFEEKNIFADELRNMDSIYEWVNWQLWRVRKHMVLDDIEPEFQYFDLRMISQSEIVPD